MLQTLYYYCYYYYYYYYCPSAILPTTNPAWTGLGSNSALRGEKRGTKYVSHGVACIGFAIMKFIIE
jgi:hypothetical protein